MGQPISTATEQPSTFSQRFVRHDPSGAIQAITAALVGIWPKGTQPRNATAAGQRAQVMTGKAQPIKPLYALALAGLDEGKSVECVTKWAKDFIAHATQYAKRHEYQSLGVIPIHEAHNRVLVAAIREDAEADCREATVDLDSIESVEAARAERIDAMAKEERKIEFYTNRLAELRARAGR